MNSSVNDKLAAIIQKVSTNAGYPDLDTGMLANQLRQSHVVEPIGLPCLMQEQYSSRGGDVVEFTLVGARSHRATRVASVHLNIINLIGALTAIGITAATASPTSFAINTLIGFLSSFNTVLTSAQAIVLVSIDRLTAAGDTPTAAALAKQCSAIDPNQSMSEQDVLEVARELKRLGVKMAIGAPPNHVIRHQEWTITVPGL